MASWSATQNVWSSDLENVGQGHHLQKSLYLSYYINDDFYQTFIEIMQYVAGNRNVISADLENVWQGRRLQKLLYIGFYMTYFNQTFTKI